MTTSTLERTIDATPAVALTVDGRPGCVHVAALRHQLHEGRTPVSAPPHVSALASPACEQYWTEWAEQVRAAVRRARQH